MSDSALVREDGPAEVDPAGVQRTSDNADASEFVDSVDQAAPDLPEDEATSPLSSAPLAHEALETNGHEDVVATSDIQLEASNVEIRDLERAVVDKVDATADEPSSSVQTQGRPVTPNVPEINVEQPTPTTAPRGSSQDTNRTIDSPPKRKFLSSSSLYFVKKTMDVILTSREGKKKGILKDVAQKLSDTLQTLPANGVDPNMIFEPLRIACESQSVTITTQALDCIGKLIAISFFDALPPTPPTPVDADEDNVVPAYRADTPTRPLMDRVIDTICECFQGEGTDEKIQLQIIKALLSAVLDEQSGTMIHQSPLLKAIRQTYNIFLLSRSTPTQSIAQGTLEQMVHAIFGRVKVNVMDGTPMASTDDLRALVRGEPSKPRTNGNEQGTSEEAAQEKVTLDSFARRQSFDQIPDTNADASLILSDDEVLVKDAFLVFRSMCKLSTKSLGIDSVNDLKSPMVRSKLLSLHMISTILNKHIALFLSLQTRIRSSAASEGIQFIQATKQYLCHALSRNAVSHIPQVFEVSCEIFWRMIDSLRGHLKKEIEVFMIEIYLPILEMKTSSYQQKLTFINVLTRLCNHPRALIEVYLNYDCDRGAMDNIYER